jgi:hypothetical protein
MSKEPNLMKNALRRVPHQPRNAAPTKSAFPSILLDPGPAGAFLNWSFTGEGDAMATGAMVGAGAKAGPATWAWALG